MVPDGLGVGGEKLWTGITDGRELDPASESLVLNCCRIADRLDELTDEIGGQLTVMNDKGDVVANPLITEHRQQLSVLRQTFTTLGLGKLPAAVGGGKSLKDQLAEARKARAPRLA